jgi:hypothetical protein
MVNIIPPAPRIALVALDILGDGLIHLMMSYNLQRNGFDVTHYGNSAHQMRHWLPCLNIRPYPPFDQLETELADYDLAIVFPPRALRDRLDAASTVKLREKWLLFGLKTPETWHFDHAERIRKTHPDLYEPLKRLLHCGHSIRFRKDSTESMVEIVLQFMHEKMQLETVTKALPVVAPVGLQYRRYRHRIIISPDSGNNSQKKDWRPASFLKLCERLKKKNYAPEIVVAPKNHALWVNRVGNAFPVPRFDDIGDLCVYLYESGLVIANDSGNGHLASFLEIPVITLYRKKNPLFTWRPDFGLGKVITPNIRLPPWCNKFLWRHLVSPSKIISAVEQLQKQSHFEGA